MNMTLLNEERVPPRSELARPVLNRTLLSTGDAGSLLMNDDPSINLISDVERRASLATFMKSRPDGDLWVFAYGSLIWNPAMRIAERRIARVNEWHRTFCLSMTAGRGTSTIPGLALGLDRGGECLGVAYRIAEQDVASELPILWSREMLLGGYIPQWTEVRGAGGEVFGHAITFIIDAQHSHYAGDISLRATVRRLATAAGSWGRPRTICFARLMHCAPTALRTPSSRTWQLWCRLPWCLRCGPWLPKGPVSTLQWSVPLN